MRQIVWKIQFLAPLPVYRHCKKCGCKKRFFSSERFRVNAQKKVLDIWLIYKCETCSTTWNVTVFSRTAASSINPALLHAFHTNEKTVCGRYATDAALLRRNGAEVQPPPFAVEGEIPSEEAEVTIDCSFPSLIKLEAVLRQKLSLSHRALANALANGAIVEKTGQDIRRCMVRDGSVLFIQGEKLPFIEKDG